MMCDDDKRPCRIADKKRLQTKEGMDGGRNLHSDQLDHSTTYLRATSLVRSGLQQLRVTDVNLGVMFMVHNVWWIPYVTPDVGHSAVNFPCPAPVFQNRSGQEQTRGCIFLTSFD